MNLNDLLMKLIHKGMLAFTVVFIFTIMCIIFQPSMVLFE